MSKRQIGSKNANAVLTDSEIPEIRQKLKDGIQRIEIAQEHGVTEQTIKDIDTGKTWSHIKK